MNVYLFVFLSGLSKAETQALTNYGSGEDENEEEEMEEFEAGPVDVQTSLQATADGQVEQEVRAKHKRFIPWTATAYINTILFSLTCVIVSCFRGHQQMKSRRLKLNRGLRGMMVRDFLTEKWQKCCIFSPSVSPPPCPVT